LTCQHRRSRLLLAGFLLTTCVVLLLGCSVEKRALDAYRNGVTSFSDGRVDEAVILFNKALVDDPSLAMAHYYVGSCYLETDPPWPLVAEEEFKLALEMLNETPEQLAKAGPELEALPLDQVKAKILLGMGKASAQRAFFRINLQLDLRAGAELLSSALGYLKQGAKLDPENREIAELADYYNVQIHQLRNHLRGVRAA
jgi:tetratricopeptide (TPR) repeat protein